MDTIYVKAQGTVVRQRGERMVITKGREVVDDIPLIHVGQVMIIGKVQLTTAALAMLLGRGLKIVLCSLSGNPYATLTGPTAGGRDAEIRRLQYQAFSDEQVVLTFARAVALGKLHNQRTLLQRQAGNATGRGAAEVLGKAIVGMAAAIRGAESTTDVESLRGYEGRGAAYYFGGWRVLMPPDMPFEGRNYHPALDAVNALLSFGYMQLTRMVSAAVAVVGFDAYLGAFHEIKAGRESLVLDLVEEWRPIIVDGMVLELLHRRMITPADFERSNNPNRPILLTDAARVLVWQTFEERIGTKVAHPLLQTGAQTSYRRCFELQVRGLQHWLAGQRDGYVPMVIR